MLTIVYPGTFDPFTRGHEDLARRASRLFGRVVVAVAAGEAKRPMFTLDERVAMAKEVLAGASNVEVVGFSTLLMKFVHEQGARAVLRGLRAVSDFEYEFQMAMVNRRLASEVETVFLVTKWEHSYLSSSIVREVALLGGDYRGLVPEAVAEILEQALAHRGVS